MAGERVTSEVIVKQGWVCVRSRRLGLWQRRWLVLRRADRSGRPSGGPTLEKFSSESAARAALSARDIQNLYYNAQNRSLETIQNVINQQDNQVFDFRTQPERRKMISLEGVSEVCRLADSVRAHALVIHFQNGTKKRLSLDSDLEANNWVAALRQECVTLRRPGVGLVPVPGLGGGIASGEPDLLCGGAVQRELAEQFHVYLMPSTKLDAFGEALLQVTHENIYLWEVQQPGDLVARQTRIAAWPLTALRRYGSDASKFTFEAGRHCATGEGLFIFHTQEGEAIYRKVHQATLAIAEAHHRCKTSPPTTIAPPTAETEDAPKPPTNQLTLPIIRNHSQEETTDLIADSEPGRGSSSPAPPPLPPPRKSLVSHHLTPSLSYGTTSPHHHQNSHHQAHVEFIHDLEPSIV